MTHKLKPEMDNVSGFNTIYKMILIYNPICCIDYPNHCINDPNQIRFKNE